jgi:alpha-1,3/alpha-1,6-mannosyltransferase
MPLDYLEEVATGCADLILVNSNFTAGVFGQTFKRLAAQGVQPAVLYPAVAVPTRNVLKEAAGCWQKELQPELVQLITHGPTLLSINRCRLADIVHHSLVSKLCCQQSYQLYPV